MKYMLFLLLGLSVPLPGMLIPFDYSEPPANAQPEPPQQLIDVPLTLCGHTLRKMRMHYPSFQELPIELRKAATIVHAIQTYLQSRGFRSINQCCPLYLQEAKLDPTDVPTASKVIEAFGNPLAFFKESIRAPSPSTKAYEIAAVNVRDAKGNPLMNKNDLNAELFTVAAGEDVALATALLRAGADPRYEKCTGRFGWAQLPSYRSSLENASPVMRALFEAFLNQNSKL